MEASVESSGPESRLRFGLKTLLVLTVIAAAMFALSRYVAEAVVTVGFVLLVLTEIWFLAVVSRSGTPWFLGVLFVPGISVFYLVKHWEQGWPPYAARLGATLIWGMGAIELNDYELEAWSLVAAVLMFGIYVVLPIALARTFR